MICLGCGSRCKCPNPATFPTWPLETSISREGLEHIELALRAYCVKVQAPEVENTANIIWNYLFRATPPAPVDDLLI